MKEKTLAQKLENVKERNNEAYYSEIKRVVDLIYSFADEEECWSNLRGADAHFLLKGEENLLDNLKEANLEIYASVKSLAECFGDSL